MLRIHNPFSCDWQYSCTNTPLFFVYVCRRWVCLVLIAFTELMLCQPFGTHFTLCFYPCGASSVWVIAITVCLCVCLCVTRRYCIKTAKRRITETTPRDSPGTLVFWHQNSLVDDNPFPLKFALKVTHPPFVQYNFDQYLLIAPQPQALAKKVQLALIGSRPRTFQRAIDEPCTLPLNPSKGCTKRDIAIFFQ